MKPNNILVTGATGAQGGAVVDAFLAGGWRVTALVRSPSDAAARRLAARGVELAPGSFEDPASLADACRTADAVFSVQLAIGSPPGSEVAQARNLMDAARRTGVRAMIHSSVSATGWRDGLPPALATDSPLYWDCKEEVERLAQACGFEKLTVLKPAFMMENFVPPKARQMFPDLAQRAILVAMPVDQPLALVAARDIGAAAFAAATRPSIFAGRAVELAGDILSVAGIAEVIGTTIGAPVHVEQRSRDELIARGQHEGWVDSQLWIGRIGYPARPEHQRELGLAPTSFIDWARINITSLRQATGAG